MLEKIKEYVDKELDIDISKRCNKEEYTFGRALYYKLCSEFYKTSNRKMTEIIGVRSHGAVINAKNNTFPYAMEYPEYKASYLKIQRILKGVNVVDPYSKIKILEQEVSMLRSEVDRLRVLQAIQ